MAVFQYFDSFSAAPYNGVHNLATDQLMIALTAAANPPVAANAVLTDLTQIAYTNLSSRVVTTTSSTQTAGLYKLILADLVLTASGDVAAFQHVVLYDNTATNKELIGWWDYAAPVTLHNTDTFTVDFHVTNGVLQNAHP